MKKRQLVRHLERHGCRLLRQGRRHEWWESSAGDRSAVPRHNDISGYLARKICRDLGVEIPGEL
ncbi:MAG: type II toxin-antitoxin system HicA family toxin [Boseongicola sp. SB0670_bin_30]|nr:type II toxin-antitoxin system HicA family toxin [Boseongicola sp. SB0670_bin_30]